jgi:PBP1b-binding outer membrane lipoprotein LpoB
MVKKILSIIVVSLLLVSCSEYSNESKIEKCADPKALELGGGVATNES